MEAVAGCVQAIRFHPEWLQRFSVAGNSMLDIYAAFGRGDLAFSVPMVLESRYRQVPLNGLLQQNVPALYMQTVAGLVQMEALTDRPDDAMSQAFAVAAWQCSVVFTAMVETPKFSVQASEKYLMRDARSGRNVAEQELLMRIQVRLLQAVGESNNGRPAMHV